MAKLHVMDDFVGPGEERTATTLSESLPEGWEIFAGRKLPGRDRDDTDLIVVAENLIFVLDEKSWGPRVIVGDQTWQVKDENRRNPLDRCAHLGRKLASLLSDKIPVYRANVARQKVVRVGVVLSHPNLTLLGGRNNHPDEIVLPLAEAAKALTKLDQSEPTHLKRARDRVVGVLLAELTNRDRSNTIGDYQILKSQGSFGRAQLFQAEHTMTGEIVQLRCYPRSGWGAGNDPTIFLRREVDALSSLADLDRTWRYFGIFEEPDRDWLVIPLIPPSDGRNLVGSIAEQDPAREGGVVPDELAAGVIADSFEGLNAIHDAGLVHRVLTPDRIWLGRAMRVRFSDFYISKIEGNETVFAWAEDEQSLAYRAPECQETISLAVPASDVFSLALCMTQWWSGQTDMSAPDATDWLADHGELGTTLASALTDKAKARPTASDLALEFVSQRNRAKGSPPTQADQFTEGAQIGSRYDLRRKLGEGGLATSWLAYDQERHLDVVLKQLHSDDFADAARLEFGWANKIRVARCARVWDIQTSHSPKYLVLEYIEGEALRERIRRAPLTVDSARFLAASALDILQELHSADFTHGDVSGGNILVDEDWRPSLIDFGLAAAPGGKSRGGTPATMAPELFEGSRVTPQSDMYSLACTILTSMLGRLPYVGPGTGADRDSSPSFLTTAEEQQWGAEGSALIRVLFNGLASDPKDRPATCHDFAAQIRAAAAPPAPRGGERTINPTVDFLRHLYRGSDVGNAGNRGLDDQFAIDTYIPTLLDTKLQPAVISGTLDVVLLTGNPGDGKTSFLVKLHQALLDAGGAELNRDAAGWRVSYNGRSYAAVYDASESHEGLSSDDLVRSALIGDGGLHTALLAVNDGRLLQFFTDYSHEFPEIQEEVLAFSKSEPSKNERIAIVDLKRRSLAGVGHDGLGLKIADAFVNEERWRACEGCLSREVCPIKLNASRLNQSARPAVAELILTSHLRRRRRATFRDVRSALAWLITGDLGCEDVHSARERGMNLLKSEERLTPDLAFASESSDYLVREWSGLDPALAAAPQIERRLRQALGGGLTWNADLSHSLRATFFGLRSATEADRAELRGYRYLEEYLSMLQTADDSARDRILLGISKIAGASGYRNEGLALGEQQPGGGWAVLRSVGKDNFSLVSEGQKEEFVESIPDELTLNYQSGGDLRLPLDTVELILRAADGELLGDSGSDAVIQEIASFADRVRKEPSVSAMIIDPAGVADEVRLTGTTIERVRE